MASTVMIIAGRELSRSVRDTRFLGAFVACLVLVVGSVAINMQSYARKTRDYDTSRNSYARMISEKAKLATTLTTTPKPIARKPVATQFIALAGENDPDPRSVAKLEYSPWFHGELRKDPLPALFFPADLVFVFGLVLPLFAFALASDGLSGDAQLFTAKLVLSGPVSRSSFIIGKWLGTMAAILMAFAASAAAASIVLVYYARTVPFSADDALAVMAFFACGILYTCAIASLALMVSSFFRTHGSAMLCLVLLWLFFFVGLPYSATSIAYTIVNPPGVASFEHHQYVLGHAPYNTQEDRLLPAAARKLGMSDKVPPEVLDLMYESDSALQVHPLGKMVNAVNEELWSLMMDMVDAKAAASMEQTRWEQRVENLAEWIRRLSPYGCFLNASVTLANTGFGRELQLRDMAQRYLYDCTALSKRVGGQMRLIPAGALPMPTLHEPPAAKRLQESLIDIMMIGAFGVMAFLVTYRNFTRREII